MSKEDIYQGLKEAIIALDDTKVAELVDEGSKAGLPPIEIILEGLGPGLTIIGDEFAANERFMSDLMIAGQIMNETMGTLLPTVDVDKEIGWC